MKSILPILLVLLNASLALAGEPRDGKIFVTEDFWSGPVIGGGVKANGELTDGNAFVVAPLLNTIGRGGAMEGAVLFLEPYATWSEGGELGTSLGLGFRRLFRGPGAAGEGFYLGANLFLDYLETELGNAFWQGGVGFEAGTRHLEFRGNYYAPFEKDDVVGGWTAVQGRTVTSFELFEEALNGWDLELAWLVPWMEDVCELRVVGGYYGYNGERVSDIEGLRAGLEYRPVPAVVLHGTWFESSQLYDDNWLAGVRFEVPLGGDWRSAFSPRRRHLAERLFEPVRRKNSSITTAVGGAVVSQYTISEVPAPKQEEPEPETPATTNTPGLWTYSGSLIMSGGPDYSQPAQTSPVLLNVTPGAGRIVRIVIDPNVRFSPEQLALMSPELLALIAAQTTGNPPEGN